MTKGLLIALVAIASGLTAVVVYYRTSPYQACLWNLADQASAAEARAICADPKERIRHSPPKNSN
jgi:hypothetical protein